MSAPRSQRPLNIAVVLSLLIHGLALLLTLGPPKTPPAGNLPLQARLQPRPTEHVRAEAPPPPARSKPGPSRKSAAPPILTARAPSPRSAPRIENTPTWSVAQKEEMNRFLDELAGEARHQPDLAQRSLAMARDLARNDRHRAGPDAPGEIVERIPDSPPIDDFSLEMYLDSLVRKLNRSASFVKNDPRSRGMQSAEIQVRINPDGSLRLFRVLRSGDQQEEIDFVKSVVERAIPFAAFPPDIVRSARSLALMICIQPAGSSGGGFGFTRRPDGSRC